MSRTDYKLIDLRNQLFNTLNSKQKVKHEFRHVKSHSKVKDSRSYVNRWCDKEARKILRNEVNKIENNLSHEKTIEIQEAYN